MGLRFGDPEASLEPANTANRLAGIGRHEEALAPATQSVAVFKGLATTDPVGSTPPLAQVDSVATFLRRSAITS